MDDLLCVIHQMEEYGLEASARAALAALAGMDGYLGGRLLPPAARGWWEKDLPPSRIWRVQALFLPEPGDLHWWDYPWNMHAPPLPDGLRRCKLLPRQYREFGIDPEKAATLVEGQLPRRRGGG